ncbi:peptide methionine sulfoxide reductase [Arsukibacterium ikkense]|uniref:Peptide methionine sulfoxide reductase MsrA n=1 Tax=Arsukibacterium ikkense TaxID=336831 RepID=A0A0M2V2B9_9GAMM|nr:peptide-methionine (S)-S-oxide reductase MsrA [Arsukibacterium ikkense]KKO44529.1 peptide methionine sulfoxide reductase [Arsukibacterium ikkense]
MKYLSFIVALLLSLLVFSALNAPAQEQAVSSRYTVQQPDDKLPSTAQLDSIVLGSGCFWGAEMRYERLAGVVDAVSGYADGQGVKPTYRAITQRSNKNNPNNHAEVVQVTFNPQQISLEALLQHYFESHDPTQLNRQGNDIGTQYRSIILTNSPEQQARAQAVLQQYQPLLTAAGYGKIVTQLKPLPEFFPAEEYHQDYIAKNPNGYCPDHSTGVRFNRDSAIQTAAIDNNPLLTGKQIVVIDSESYCPYCEKFKAEVANDYQGDIPLNFRFARQLAGLAIKTDTSATPTIILLQDGQEVFAFRGYLAPDEFYLLLGKFKLGDSEAFNVAFDKGTDQQFCKEYQIFKNTPDGVFVDKLSGAALFDTRDRFDSGTGWLSFTKAVAGAVTERPDNRYGMRRTEIRAAISGIHLGHVFPDGPKGQPRYCINATVLDFMPRG